MKNWITVIVIIIVIGAAAWLILARPATEPSSPPPSDMPVTVAPVDTTTQSATTPSTAPQATTPPVKPITTITTKDNMTIETVKEGSGPAITNGQTATVNYVGKLADGTVFDASANHGGTFDFVVGAGTVIKGWDEGVLGMKVGEERILTIPPALAYGAGGIPGAIPANATLTFDVTLIAIK